MFQGRSLASENPAPVPKLVAKVSKMKETT